MKFGRKVTAAALAAGLALTAVACSPAGGDDAGDPQATWDELSIATVVNPQSWDPAQASEAHFAQYFQPVFDTLVRRLPDGELAPMLATTWTVSDDGMRVSLDLRDDVTFSDGTAFDADVAKLNLERFRDAGGPFSTNLATLESVDVVDEDTIDLVLSEPTPEILASLGNSAGYMASPAQFDSAEKDTAPIGSGAYELDRSKSVSGSEWVFTKREGYWDADASWNFFDTLVLKPMPEPTARMNALKSGEVDSAVVDPKVFAEAEASGLTVTPFQVDWVGLTIFDRQGTLVPALADVRVRQAINMAVDRDSILQAVELGYGEPTNQIFNTSSAAYIEGLDSEYEYDVDGALALMDEAGFADGFDMTLPSQAGIDPAIIAALTDQLGALNIRVTWDELASASFNPEVRAGKYPMAWLSFVQTPTAWGSVSRLVLPDAAWNVLQVQDAELDAVLSDALANVTDEAEFGSSLQEINEFLVSQAWFAPAYRVERGIVTAEGLEAAGQSGQAAPSIYNYAVTP